MAPIHHLEAVDAMFAMVEAKLGDLRDVVETVLSRDFHEQRSVFRRIDTPINITNLLAFLPTLVFLHALPAEVLVALIRAGEMPTRILSVKRSTTAITSILGLVVDASGFIIQ